MLKTRNDGQTWLVQQHHHAQISGYLAAHWGGANGFARPGHFPGATHPSRWRDEVVLSIAEHDNGWWESEAMPRISDRDGLPVGVGEAAAPTPENELAEWRAGGFDRWRRGIARLTEPHPYAALLVSLHAYWLYAVAFDDLVSGNVGVRRHPVFGAPEVAAGLTGDVATTRSFLDEQSLLQDRLVRRLEGDREMSLALQPRHLDPHLRLLQFLDSMSLFLSMNDPEQHDLEDVPRESWNDRCTILWERRDKKNDRHRAQSLPARPAPGPSSRPDPAGRSRDERDALRVAARNANGDRRGPPRERVTRRHSPRNSFSRPAMSSRRRRRKSL